MGSTGARGARRPVLLGVLAAAGALAGSAAPAQGPPSLQLRPIVFETSFGDQLPAEQGTLTVPENRSVPGGATIGLEVIRFPGAAGASGPPVVLLEGGPGQAGIATATGRRILLIQRLQALGDVIVFDQRGVGESDPQLDCKESLEVPPGTELTYEGWIADLEVPSQRCARGWARQGVDLSAYNTGASADDVDDLRAALGVERIHLWGQSYGTLLALAVMRQHPESVARAALHGVLGPDHLAALPKSTDKILRRLLRLAEREGGRRLAGLAEQLGQVLAELEAAPARVSIPDPRDGSVVETVVGTFEVRFLINFAILGDRTLMQRLPAWIAAMHAGDFSTIATLGLELRRWNPLAMRMAMVCTTGTSAGRQRKIDRQAPRTLLGSLPRLPDICPPWEVEPLGPEFLEPIVADVPVLLISGTLDSVTPLANAKAVAKRLTASESLLLVGGTHGDLVHGDPRIIEEVAAFFAGGAPSVRRIELPPWSFAATGS